MKFFVTKCYKDSCNLLPLRAKQIPQKPILQHPQLMRFSKAKEQDSHPHITKRKIIILYVLIFVFSGIKKDYGPNCSRQDRNFITYS